MKLATTIGDFEKYVSTSAEAVCAYEGTGFTHLDYSFYHLNKPGSPFMGENRLQQVKAAAVAAERLGFDFVQAHSPGNDWFSGENRENITKGNIYAIEACAYLGIKRLVVHSGRSSCLFYPGDWHTYLNEVKAFYETLYPAMEKYGVFVLAENYIPAGAPLCSFYSAEALTQLMEVCNHPLLGVCWDVGHANLTNPDQYQDIVALGNYLQAVHIQDNMGKNDDHLCPLMGTLDLDAVMRALQENGFISRGGVFTFECDNILSTPSSWPNYRNGNRDAPMNTPTLEAKRAAVAMMYQIGKSTLEKFGCFEE